MSIQVENVTKFYNQTPVVRDVSLHIQTGELFVLLGASGSGKSTLLRMIAGLTPLDKGRIKLHDRDVTGLPPQQRDAGFVFQNYSLFRHMTAAQNIAFGLSIRRQSKAEQERRVNELLELIQLPGLGGRMPAQLSGGQQQRIALARALAHGPQVLLLDEPFGALDAKIRVQLRQNLREIQRRLGLTALLVTHDQDEAFELADRIGIIDKGELLEVGTSAALYRAPQHRFTATFLGSANLLPARRNGRYVYLDEVPLPAPPDSDHLANSDVDLFSRPEDVTLAATVDALQGQSIGCGVVEEIIFSGPVERIVVRLRGERTVTALLTPAEAAALDLRPGARGRRRVESVSPAQERVSDGRRCDPCFGRSALFASAYAAGLHADPCEAVRVADTPSPAYRSEPARAGRAANLRSVARGSDAQTRRRTRDYPRGSSGAGWLFRAAQAVSGLFRGECLALENRAAAGRRTRPARGIEHRPRIRDGIGRAGCA